MINFNDVIEEILEDVKEGKIQLNRHGKNICIF